MGNGWLDYCLRRVGFLHQHRFYPPDVVILVIGGHEVTAVLHDLLSEVSVVEEAGDDAEDGLGIVGWNAAAGDPVDQIAIHAFDRGDDRGNPEGDAGAQSNMTGALVGFLETNDTDGGLCHQLVVLADGDLGINFGAHGLVELEYMGADPFCCRRR